MRTKHTNIKGSESELTTFHKSLDFYIFIKPKRTLSELVDIIFDRVQDILGMKKEYPAITIQLCSQDALKSNWKTYNKSKVPKAFYVHKSHTIFINTKTATKGILAHEMTHSILDNYLLVKPPRNTSEILCRYVDRNLGI